MYKQRYNKGDHRGIYSSLYASKWDRKEIDRFVNSGRKLSQGKKIKNALKICTKRRKEKILKEY